MLVLDGLEVFQRPPGPLEGRLAQAEPILTLLLDLATGHPGLCVVTTRIPLVDLEASLETSVIEQHLGPLTPHAGEQLLRQLKLNGDSHRMRAAVAAYWGHPLSLVLLAKYLKARYRDADIRHWNRELLTTADAREGGRARRLIEDYVSWLEDGAQVAILRCLTLFDEAIAEPLLSTFREPPAIAGLTEALLGISDEGWDLALADLARGGLLHFSGGASNPTDVLMLDLHPLVRRFLGAQLQASAPESWRSGHERMNAATRAEHV